MNRQVIWEPQPRQNAFMQCWQDEALYGGAAGGGKSDCLVNEALRQVSIPYYRALIVRRTFPQLEDLIGKSLRYYSKAFPGAKYNAGNHTWTFPSGAVVIFGSMQHEKDKLNYQGKPYDFIGFDELTQFTYSMYDYLVHSRNRPNSPGTRVYSRATANPGGVGHGWVKEYFITAAPPMKTVWKPVDITFPDGHSEKRWKSSVFINSSVFDNKKLLDNDPDYLTRLASMPDADKKALLYGDWNSFSGQVFTEWRDNQGHYADRMGTHVINPFHVPDDWRIYRGFDWGYSRPFSVGWYAVDHDKRLYRIRELYGCTGEPNRGVKWEPSRVARKIKEIEQQDENLKNKKIIGIADPAIFSDSGTESVAALMEKEGVYWERGDNPRIQGKMQLHNRLAFDAAGVPMIYVFSTCKHFIRTVPALVYDETDVEDVNTEGEDHIYDECRYVCMANPIAPRQIEERKPLAFDPLDLQEQNQRMDSYAWYRNH